MTKLACVAGQMIPESWWLLYLVIHVSPQDYSIPAPLNETSVESIYFILIPKWDYDVLFLINNLWGFDCNNISLCRNHHQILAVSLYLMLNPKTFRKRLRAAWDDYVLVLETVLTVSSSVCCGNSTIFKQWQSHRWTARKTASSAHAILLIVGTKRSCTGYLRNDVIHQQDSQHCKLRSNREHWPFSLQLC